MMSRLHGRFTSPALCALFAAALASQAHAGCGSAHRVSPQNSQCFDGGWSNGFGGEAWAQRQSTCDAYLAAAWSDRYRKVVVKVDRITANDWTWTFDEINDPRRTKKEQWDWPHIRGVYCCKDLGLCNNGEMVTPEGCSKRFFQAARNADSCTIDEVAADSYYGTCSFTWTCSRTPGSSFTQSTSVPYLNVDKLFVGHNRVQIVETIILGQ